MVERLGASPHDLRIFVSNTFYVLGPITLVREKSTLKNVFMEAFSIYAILII